MTSQSGHAALKLDAFVRQYRSMALVRCALPLALAAMLATVAPLGFTAAFAAVHFALYLAFFGVIEIGARDRSLPEKALRRMAIRTAIIGAIITLHACWMLLQLRNLTGEPVVRTEAALVVIGVLMFTATQTHMTRWGYMVGIAPAVVALLLIALNQHPSPNPHLVLVVCLFLIAVVAVTWRQQSTDLALRDTKLALEQKNRALSAMVAEADAARTQAEAANRAKSDFLAMTSHEIRTPLNAVLGLAEALHRSPLPTQQAEMARGVVDAGALLKRLLDAMLDVSRIEAGKMTLSPKPFDLRRAIETLVRIWTPKAAEAGVTLTFDLAGLPAGGLMIDGPKVEQMLFNLASNAVKFSPDNGEVVIRAATVPRDIDNGVTVVLEVLDQGPGVAPQDRPRIFRSFEQAQAGRDMGGAGLGLAICAGNVALMEGTITVDDAPGGGAAFCILFPAETCDLTEAASEQAISTGLDEERPLRVLAAEDNAGNRHVLEVLLGPLPVALTVVEDGAQAVAAEASGAFDMVLMDANMPVMDGLTALRAIRSSGSATPVWMLTANVFEEDVARYRAAGADGVLSKPIELGELFAALAQAAQRADGEAGAVAA